MLVKTLISNILVYKQLLWTMSTITQQIHHIPVLHSRQQFCLVRELFLPLPWAMQKFLHCNLPSILQLPLYLHNPNNHKCIQIILLMKTINRQAYIYTTVIFGGHICAPCTNSCGILDGLFSCVLSCIGATLGRTNLFTIYLPLSFVH